MKKLEMLLIERNEILQELKKDLPESIKRINKMLLKLINIKIKLHRDKT